MITSDKKIKFAVIGCGHIGKRHAEMIDRNPEAELVALVDTKEKKDLFIDHFNAAFFSSVEELLSDKLINEIDVIYIASPNGYHATHAL